MEIDQNVQTAVAVTSSVPNFANYKEGINSHIKILSETCILVRQTKTKFNSTKDFKCDRKSSLSNLYEFVQSYGS